MSAASPLKTSDLIFPELSTNFSDTLSSLKRSALSISNRLNSISQDAEFVFSVADAWGLPLVANERCGSWYIPPDRKSGSAYFKSTDGHTGQWSFSLRRLNTQVLDIIGTHDGCIIVDSTRRGKSMPDALLKTVPIWCCVLNRVLFSEIDHPLYTPPQTISASEHDQIEARVPAFVRLLKDLGVNLEELRAKISKPLRPIWITQESSIPTAPSSFPDFHPVVLCTSSRRVRGGEVSEGGYIQGAADDHEAWACGLTPPVFWENKDFLLSTNEEQLPEVISRLIKPSTRKSGAEAIQIKPTPSLYVCSTVVKDIQQFDTIISCTKEPLSQISSSQRKKYLHLKCRQGKLGSRDLRDELPKLTSFISKLNTREPGSLFVCCPTGQDLSLGVALCILCLYTSSSGTISTQRIPSNKIDKNFIRQRLSWITTSYPTANPARATLQSVNSFLFSLPAAAPTNAMSSVASSDPDIGTLDLSESPTPTLQSQSARLFSSLSGNWTVNRTLKSYLPTQPSGKFTGKAVFKPRTPGDIAFSEEYLYEEEGTFRTQIGFEFSARKRYAYRFDEVKDEISVWFVDEGKEVAQPEVTGLFVEMGMREVGSEEQARAEGTGQGRVRLCEGKEKHLCGEDLYAASYRFGPGMIDPKSIKDSRDEWWEVRYDVKGPKKDYISETRYERI